MKNIIIVGGGQLGSRHLQALKNVRFPLNILVVDPSPEALDLSRQRYESVPSESKNKIEYCKDFSSIGEKIDLAIIATNSDVRSEVIENLLNITSVKYFILEKILFVKEEDYQKISNMLKLHGSKSWVNCSMRMMPFYADLKKDIGGSKLLYSVTGSNIGLITTCIHFIDHIIYLTGCSKFDVDCKYLDKVPIKSKRPGFSELTGTLMVNFEDGSIGVFTSLPNGNNPFYIEINSDEYKCISSDSEKKAWVWSSKNPHFTQIEANIPFQSQLTTWLVDDLLTNSNCNLPTYAESSKTHKQLFRALNDFLLENQLHDIKFT